MGLALAGGEFRLALGHPASRTDSPPPNRARASGAGPGPTRSPGAFKVTLKSGGTKEATEKPPA